MKMRKKKGIRFALLFVVAVWFISFLSPDLAIRR